MSLVVSAAQILASIHDEEPEPEIAYDLRWPVRHPPTVRPVEATQILHCSRRTLDRLIEAGELAPLERRTPGGHRRFLKADVQALAERRRRNTTTAQG